MTKRAAVITQADVARVLRAVKASGVDARVEIRPDGTIVVVNNGDSGEARRPGAGHGPDRFAPSQGSSLW